MTGRKRDTVRKVKGGLMMSVHLLWSTILIIDLSVQIKYYIAWAGGSMALPLPSDKLNVL